MPAPPVVVACSRVPRHFDRSAKRGAEESSRAGGPAAKLEDFSTPPPLRAGSGRNDEGAETVSRIGKEPARKSKPDCSGLVPGMTTGSDGPARGPLRFGLKRVRANSLPVGSEYSARPAIRASWRRSSTSGARYPGKPLACLSEPGIAAARPPLHGGYPPRFPVPRGREK